MRSVNNGDTWDFSHTPSFFRSTLGENPGHDIYLTGYAASYLVGAGNQAPVYTGFLMPSELGQPTKMLCLQYNQLSTNEFTSFDRLGLFWKASDDPDHKGRVHYLACNRDLGSVSENDAYLYEYANIFMPSPDDLSTKRHGKILVDKVSFPITLLDGDSQQVFWFPKEQNLNNCIISAVEQYYDENDRDEFEEFGFFSDDEITLKIDEIKVNLKKVSFLMPKFNHFLTHAQFVLT